ASRFGPYIPSYAEDPIYIYKSASLTRHPVSSPKFTLSPVSRTDSGSISPSRTITMSSSKLPLLSMARTALLGVAAGSRDSIQDVLDKNFPGLSALQSFFSTWLKIDITTLAVALTVLGGLPSALGDLQSLLLKLYWWFAKFFTASVSIAGNDRLN